MRKLILGLIVPFLLLVLNSCGDSDSDRVVVAPEADEPAVSAESVDAFAAVGDDVAAVTPQVNFTAANTNLDNWADWRDPSDDVLGDPMTQLAVFEKLLSDSAESVFAPARFLEDLVYIMDRADSSATGVWDEAGIVTLTETDPATGETAEMEVTVAIVETAVNLPVYFQDKVDETMQAAMSASINRIISFNFFDDDGGWDTVMAIGEDDDYYYLIASAAHEFLNETQTFVAFMDRNTETMTLHYASVDDDIAEGGIYSKWSGNTLEDWFSIAQVSGGSSGNQEVVGGGEDMGEVGSIAFKSRNNGDDTADSTDVYYLANLTTRNIEDGTDPGGAPTLGEPTAGTGSIEYIIEGNAKCPGWLGQNEYPAVRLDIAWSPVE